MAMILVYRQKSVDGWQLRDAVLRSSNEQCELCTIIIKASWSLHLIIMPVPILVGLVAAQSESGCATREAEEAQCWLLLILNWMTCICGSFTSVTWNADAADDGARLLGCYVCWQAVYEIQRSYGLWSNRWRCLFLRRPTDDVLQGRQRPTRLRV